MTFLREVVEGRELRGPESVTQHERLFLIDRDAVAVAECPVDGGVFVGNHGVRTLFGLEDLFEELDSARPEDCVQEDQVGEGFRVEVEEHFAHLVGVKEDDAVRGSAAEEAEGGSDQWVPAVFERLLEVIQDVVGGNPEFDIFEQLAIQEGDFKEAGLRLNDQFVFTVGENLPGHFQAAGASFEGDFRSVVDRLGEAGERQVPFHRIDASNVGQVEQEGVGQVAVARIDHNLGSANRRRQFLKEDHQALPSGAGVQPVQFFGEAFLEAVDGDGGDSGGFGAPEGAVECLKEFFIHD